MLPFTFSIYLEKQKLSKKTKNKNMLTQTPKGKLVRLNEMNLVSIWICYRFYTFFILKLYLLINTAHKLSETTEYSTRPL